MDQFSQPLLGRAKSQSPFLTGHIPISKHGSSHSLSYIASSYSCSAHIVKWVTESNRPANIVNDRELKELLTASRPNLEIPSASTVARDIKIAFEKCKGRIAKLLREHPGHLHFATDAWTSPNHRAIVAWTVHLEHQGHMLGFLLDVVEVPEASSVLY